MRRAGAHELLESSAQRGGRGALGVAIVKGDREPLVFDLEAGALRDVAREPRAHAIQFRGASGNVRSRRLRDAIRVIIVEIIAARLARAPGDFESVDAGVHHFTPKPGHPAQFRDRAAADDRDGDALAQGARSP